jgi:hypothetical protein
MLSFFSVYTAGISVGPSIGHLYTRNWLHAYLAFGARLTLAGGGALLYGIAGFCQDYCTESVTALYVGAGVLMASALGLAVWSVVLAPESAKEANRRQRQSRSWTLSPGVFAREKRHPVPGLWLGVTF